MHTPGPWFISETGDYRKAVYAKGRNKNPICVFAGSNEDSEAREYPNSEANAQLIAAAPDMLAALKAIVRTDVGNDTAGSILRAYPEVLRIAGAAIRAAQPNTGE